MMFIISIGKWGGVYFHADYSIRVCLGFVAFTFIPQDDDWLSDAIDIYTEKLKHQAMERANEHQ